MRRAVRIALVPLLFIVPVASVLAARQVYFTISKPVTNAYIVQSTNYIVRLHWFDTPPVGSTIDIYAVRNSDGASGGQVTMNAPAPTTPPTVPPDTSISMTAPPQSTTETYTINVDLIGSNGIILENHTVSVNIGP